MKRTTIFNLIILSLSLVLGGTACKKKPIGTTVIPGMNAPIVGNANNRPMDGGGVIPFNSDIDPSTGSIAAADNDSIVGRPQDRQKFAADTVYFDLDSGAVKGSEASKLEDVANYFKSNPVGDLLIEGHCDERGTEGYNLTLGDKRANSLREYLVNLGVSSSRLHTVSFGESIPAVTGTGEAVWSKNRRGEFVFIEPAR